MFYTYLWLREDGTPYYVGKGKGKRAFSGYHHRHGMPPKERIVMYPAESEADAFDTESALIWYYGRKDLGTGILRNLTDGGNGGCAGYKHTEEALLKIKEATNSRSEETRKKLSDNLKGIALFKGRKHSEETLQKMRAAKLGKKNTEEARRKMSETHKGLPWSEARWAVHNARRLRNA